MTRFSPSHCPSSHAVCGLTVDGYEVGEEIQMPSGGGTLEVDAWAVCAQPIHGLEIVYNGQVVASQKSESDTNNLELREKVKVDGSGWLAARCFSRYQVWHVWPVNVAAHTSPIYVIADGQEVSNPSDAVYIMTMVHGGLEWVDTLSIKADEESHQRLRSVFTSAAHKHGKKMEVHGHPHPH
ncbi:hypothetical protein ACFL6S_33055 [Candidatus Poribacteria bacterium]